MSDPNGRTIEKTDALVTPFSFMESTPFVWHDRLHLLLCLRPARGGRSDDYHLILLDVEKGERIATFGEGLGLGCLHVESNRVFVYASKWDPEQEWTQIYCLESEDLANWEQSLAIPSEPNERLFNSSVCRDEFGFIMAYESNAYVPFTVKFARSSDLRHWEKLTNCDFSREAYAACPTVRWIDGYYYLFYLVSRKPRYVTFAARSRDLKQWEFSPRNPILSPSPGEGINNSDIDLVEFAGRVYLYYATGDQQTWGGLKCAMFDGTMREFFHYLFPVNESGG